MIDFLQAVIAFLFALGVLITFHEFGHYWVARKCDVKILRFSVGFGRPIYKRLFGPDKTEFVIAALPLGGYVKMLDEREGAVAPDELGRSFNNKPVLQRIAIVVAGPLFNFIFAIFAYWLMFMVGVTGLKPVIGELAPGSIAMQAGLEPGDEIIRVDDTQTPTWASTIDVFLAGVIDGQSVRLMIRNKHNAEYYRDLDLAQVSVDEMAGGNLLTRLGITPLLPDVNVQVKEVNTDSPASAAGLLAGDRLLASDGFDIDNSLAWVSYVQERPGQIIKMDILRDTQRLSLDLVPASVTDEQGATIGRVGAVVFDVMINPGQLQGVHAFSPLGAIPRAVIKTFDMSVMTLQILGKMIMGEASVKNLSGPISIAQYAGQSAGLGLAIFLGFLAIVSVSLGVLNLLPVPLLDGGHLLYYLLELVKGSPVSDATQLVGQQLGLALLIGLMGIAFYNDIIRLVS